MSKKSCQNCDHQWVCRKWGVAVDYARSEWGGTHFAGILKEMGLLTGTYCPKYKAKEGRKQNGGICPHKMKNL